MQKCIYLINKNQNKKINIVYKNMLKIVVE